MAGYRLAPRKVVRARRRPWQRRRVWLPADLNQTVAVGTATEADTARPLTVVNDQTVAVGTATETDVAVAISISTGGGAAQGGLAFLFSGPSSTQTIAVGTATETDTALSIAVGVPSTQTIAVGTATETDTAVAIDVEGGVVTSTFGEEWAYTPLQGVGRAWGLTLHSAEAEDWRLDAYTLLVDVRNR